MIDDDRRPPGPGLLSPRCDAGLRWSGEREHGIRGRKRELSLLSMTRTVGHLKDSQAQQAMTSRTAGHPLRGQAHRSARSSPSHNWWRWFPDTRDPAYGVGRVIAPRVEASN